MEGRCVSRPVGAAAEVAGRGSEVEGVGLRFALAMVCSISAVRARPGRGKRDQRVVASWGLRNWRRTGPVWGVLPHLADQLRHGIPVLVAAGVVELLKVMCGLCCVGLALAGKCQ
jgi:hypothetical protein